MKGFCVLANVVLCLFIAIGCSDDNDNGDETFSITLYNGTSDTLTIVSAVNTPISGVPFVLVGEGGLLSSIPILQGAQFGPNTNTTGTFSVEWYEFNTATAGDYSEIEPCSKSANLEGGKNYVATFTDGCNADFVEE